MGSYLESEVQRLEDIEVVWSRPDMFKIALIVFGDTPASFVISL
jgi:hypothetical protein